MLRTICRINAGKVIPTGIAYPILAEPLKGYRFIFGAASGDGGGASVYFNLIEPEQTQGFLRNVKPGMNVLDIGANVGYYSLLALKNYWKRGFDYLHRTIFT